MPWEYEWRLDLMRDTVVIYNFSTVSAWGTNTYSTSGSTYRAWVEWGEHKVLAADGQEAVARLALYLGQTTTGGAVPWPTVKDQFVMSDSTNSSSIPRPLSMERWIDPESTQNYLTVVHCA